jgi:hypothetical protein
MKIPKLKSKWLMMTAIIVLLSAVILTAAPKTAVDISAAVSDLKPAKIKTVTGNLAEVNVGEFPQGGSPGDPMLPYKSISLLVPPDTDLKKVKVKLAAGKWEELPGEYEIAPAPPAATWNEGKFIIGWGGKDPSHIVNGRDSTIYGKNAYFPSEPVQIESVGNFRQWKIVEVKVWLAVYNPVQKKVRVVNNPQITLTVEKLPAGQAVGLDSPKLPKLPKTEKFVPELRSKISNPQDIDTFYGQQENAAAPSGPPAPLTQADFVIITTSTIVSNSTKLANFVTAKQNAGYTVKTVTGAPAEGDLCYVDGNNCNERANYIRTWLKNHYVGDGTEYVLLIGDPNPDTWTANQSIPMKWCWPRNGQAGPPEEIKAPSDMFFAELSNTWDFDGDGFYGEYNGDYRAGGADKICEVKVGRIPFYGQYADLDSILQKCIDYEGAPGNKAWRSKVLIPGTISNFGPECTDGDGVGDPPFENSTKRTFGADWGEAIKSLASSISFSPYTLYEKQGVYNDGSAYPLTACDADVNNTNFTNEWKNQYGFVTWWAHGNQTSASRFCWTSDPGHPNVCCYGGCHNETSWFTLIQWSDCAALDNNYPSFVVQVSCDNGWPENVINLGYRLLKRGAIGTISGTRVTWYSIGSWNTGIGAANGDNASYGYYCFDRMANSGESVGKALVYCRSNFGTGWAGQSWMNMLCFNIYGDPSLSLDLPGGGLKWKQDPDATEDGMDVRCDHSDGINRILADDFQCGSTDPITKVTLWGSWKNDIKGTVKKIHLSIHDDKPDSDGSGPDYSEPNTLLWSKDFYPADFNETLFNPNVIEYWWDPYTMFSAMWPGDHQIWQYDIHIPADQAYIQEGNSVNPLVYWLDAYVELDPCDPCFPTIQFGWKTSANHWNDDSVRWDNITGEWDDLRYPNPHPKYYQSIDLAFAIYTGESNEPNQPQALSYLKWSQPPVEINPLGTTVTFCGWDEKSFNMDTDPCGPWKIVADDFRCLGTMPITSIHWWGSHFGWESPNPPPPQNLPIAWRFAFWSNVPAFSPPPEPNLPYSYPYVLLHSFQVPAARVTSTRVAQDQYYSQYPPDTCFKYSLNLEPNEVFHQNDFNDITRDKIYWLSIVAVYDQNNPEPYYPWGWKSRPWHWMDDSVTFNLPSFPAGSGTLNPYQITPIKDPVFNESFDMSFELDTDPNYIKWEQSFTGIRNWSYYEDSNSMGIENAPGNLNIWRLVADDWRCVKRTPITAIVWWGSYIGFAYEACGSSLPTVPEKPDYFLLNMWTDVPANPSDPNSYSHPDHKIWEYKASNYDEVLVGYDKNPQGDPNEPVFRYSVRLPEDKWFHQPDYNEVFWLSVVAVYDTVPMYDRWGWTNHAHTFNDDAVAGTLSGSTWNWQKLEYQPGSSEDMSFMLFTDPAECSTCANYNCDSIVNFVDYADFADNWLNSVPPGGYNNSDLNCDGNINWKDVEIFVSQWLGVCP